MNKNKLFFLVVGMCAVLFTGAFFMVEDQGAANISLIANSTHDVDLALEADTTSTLTISTGLPTVGLGEAVYLTGDDDMASYAWTLTSKPTGSVAAFGDDDAQATSFLPDLAGQYEITLNVTTADTNSYTAGTMWITAATFVGVGTVGADTPSFADGDCAVCHSDKNDLWAETNHADAHTRKMDIPDNHYAGYCIACHAVGFNEAATAVNGGYDDVATDLGYVFPATAVGNFDSLVANYPTLSGLVNIQCENCHGAGSEHKGATSKNEISSTFNEGVCETCHAAETHHIFPMQWETSGHGDLARIYNNRCEPCHSANTFIATYDEDWTMEEVGEIPAENVGCSTCHDPHGNGIDHQLRTLEPVLLPADGVTEAEVDGYGQLCLQCHVARRGGEAYADTENSSHFGPHHGNQGDMYIGMSAVEYGMEIGSSSHMDVIEDSCVHCHMGATASNDEIAAMFGVADADKIEELRNNLFSHAFNLVYTDADGVVYENVTSCQECHGDIESFEDIKANSDRDGDGTIEGVQEETHGLLHTLALLLPPVGEEEVDHTTTDDTPIAIRRALFNLLVVEEDRSFGIHNAAYSFGILEASINSLSATVGSGQISDVVDIPEDQGKQVRVSWSAFAGDGAVPQTIASYGVWREVAAAAAAKVSPDNVIAVSSYDEMYNNIDLAEGKMFVVDNGATYDFVTAVPAAGMPAYSTVVATLYDGVETNFKVSGHNMNNTVVFSVPAAGTSTDDLAPAAPAMPAATILAENSIEISWNELQETDVKHFSIHRSTDATFTPGEATLVGYSTTNMFIDDDVLEIGDYYYRVNGTDFAGNTGEFSPARLVQVTGVEDDEMMPNEFGLKQNYPNPFNPTTTIEYQLPASAQVSLAIYNVLGQEVRSLVSGFESIGFKSVTWDAKDNHGRSVAPGIYIYKITAGNFTQVKKMVLIK